MKLSHKFQLSSPLSFFVVIVSFFRPVVPSAFSRTFLDTTNRACRRHTSVWNIPVENRGWAFPWTHTWEPSNLAFSGRRHGSAF